MSQRCETTKSATAAICPGRRLARRVARLDAIIGSLGRFDVPALVDDTPAT